MCVSSYMLRTTRSICIIIGCLSGALGAWFAGFTSSPTAALALGALSGLLLGVVGTLFAGPPEHELEDVRALGRIGEGDLTQDPRSDSLGRLVRNLRSSLRNLQSTSSGLIVASREVSEGTSKLLRAARRQADAAERSLGEVRSIGDDLRDTTETVGEIEELALEAGGALEQMDSSMERVGSALDTLYGFVGRTREVMEEMGASLTSFSESGQHLSGFAEEADAYVRVVSEGIQRVRARAEETGRQAQDVTERAERGFSLVSDAVQGLTLIDETVQRAASIVDVLGTRSQAIGTIIDVIEDIADQTNLLALNAAILAAQAGEHGKGFAVVAEQIRDLAERTGRSTREIATLVEEVLAQVAAAVKVMGEGRDQASAGLELGKRAAEALEDIRVTVSKTFTLVEETVRETTRLGAEGQRVAEASREVASRVEAVSSEASLQAQGGEQISQRTRQMTELTDQARRAAEEQAVSARIVTEVMLRLREGIGAVRASHEGARARTQRVSTTVSQVGHDAEGLLGVAADLARTSEQLERSAATITEDLQSFRLPAAQRGGTLRISVSDPDLLQNTRGLDPMALKGLRESVICTLVHAGLVRPGAQTEMLPDLAESWSVESGGRLYRFLLRDGLTFHDGTPCDAAAVKRSLERHLVTGQAGPITSLFEDIEGAAQFQSGEDASVHGIVAHDARHLDIRLRHPRPFLLQVLSSPDCLVSRTTDGWPVGAGPFRIVDAAPGVRLRLRRFEGCHRADRVHLDEIEVRLDLAVSAAADAVASGQLDLALDIPERYLLGDASDLPDGVTLHHHQLLLTDSLLFQCSRAPLDRPGVRRAIRASLDIDAFAAAHGGEHLIASGLIPRGLLGHVPDLPPHVLDLDQAKRFLRGEGIDDLVLDWVYSESRDESWVQTSRLLLARLPEIGIQVREMPVPQREFWERLAAGRFDLVREGWVADYPDPDCFFYFLVHSKGQTPTQLGYRNPEIDQLIDDARNTVDPDKRAEFYLRAERVLYEDPALVPLTYGTDAVLSRSDVQGLSLIPTVPGLQLDGAWRD